MEADNPTLLPGKEAREKRAALQAKREEQERRRKEDPLLRAQVLSSAQPHDTAQHLCPWLFDPTPDLKPHVHCP